VKVTAGANGAVGTVGAAVEVHHLAGGVNPGIGAAGAGHLDGFVGNASQRRLDRGLDADTVLLALPAHVGRAVVFDAECDAHQESGDSLLIWESGDSLLICGNTLSGTRARSNK